MPTAERKPADPPSEPVTGLAKMREPFLPHQISKLPKQVRKDDQDKGRCERGSRYSADGHFCNGWHARSMHLDYVGHAAITDRLLDADESWEWGPAYRDVNPNVLAAAVATGNADIVRLVIDSSPPLIDRDGGMWINLTVDGVTRLGYGDAQGKSGPNATKERIGDALRNGGMRFGAAIDLWHKGDLHADDAADESPQTEQRTPPGLQRDWIAESEKLTDVAALLDLGRQCNAVGQFVGPVKSALLARRQKLEAEALIAPPAEPAVNGATS